MPKRMDDGMPPMIRPAEPRCRATFSLRWTRIRGLKHFSRLLTGRIGMLSFGEFKRREKRRLALGRLSSLLEGWRGKRRFIPLLDEHRRHHLPRRQSGLLRFNVEVG